jgi:hypothetical protein
MGCLSLNLGVASLYQKIGLNHSHWASRAIAFAKDDLLCCQMERGWLMETRRKFSQSFSLDVMEMAKRVATWLGETLAF